MRKRQPNFEIDIVRERPVFAAFAGPRFELGSDRERALHLQLERVMQSTYDSMRAGAKLRGRAVPGGF